MALRPRSWQLVPPALTLAVAIASSPAGAQSPSPTAPGTAVPGTAEPGNAAPRVGATDQPATPPARKPRPPATRLGSVTFEPGSDALSEAARGELDRVVASLPDESSDARRIQLLAFASVEDQLASPSRRLSLARALAVRQYMAGRGVAMTRIDVRALGTTRHGEGSADRVDIVLGVAIVPAAVDRQGK
jgi:outer membrane protein OmpA-like peptidoglycan-associated protein